MKTNAECFESLMQREKTFKAEKKKRIRIIASVLPAAACFVMVVCMLPMMTGQRSGSGNEASPGVNNALGYGSQAEQADGSPSVAGEGENESLSSDCPEAEDPLKGNAGVSTKDNLPKLMPDDFAIHYETWIIGKNIYDTYEGYLQKDLVCDGTTRTALSVSDAQLAEIYKAVRKNSLDTITREMTSSVLRSDGVDMSSKPLVRYSITFTADGQIHTVTGDWMASEYVETDTDAAHFWSFVQYMNDLLYNSEEYQSLPEANGGYD